MKHKGKNVAPTPYEVMCDDDVFSEEYSATPIRKLWRKRNNDRQHHQKPKWQTRTNNRKDKYEDDED